MANSKRVKVATGMIPGVDVYIAKSADFAQPILTYLRDIVHEAIPDIREEMKWSRPFFVHRGIILGNISAFQQHCSFGLWGAEIAAVLREDGVASGEGMGTFGRIMSIKDLPSRTKLLAYVKNAAKLVEEGSRTKSLERPRVAKPAMEVPAALEAALKKNKVAAKQFQGMSPSCRREYSEWIAGAKREETRTKRVAQTLEWISEGKKLNWKYEK